ncbi:TPA: hypothetical protein ACGOV2_001307, partial [Streptococcus suis]
RDLGTVNGTMGCDIKKSSSFFITVYWMRERVDRYFVIGRLHKTNQVRNVHLSSAILHKEKYKEKTHKTMFQKH